MREKDKQLVLIDLCARLPYGVIVRYKGHNTIVKNKLLTGSDLDCNMEYYKPYLRPMDSMTEEELIEFNNIPSTKNYQIVNGDLPWDVANYNQIDWLNKNMFDYRGLIPMNLAIAVDESNNPYKDLSYE